MPTPSWGLLFLFAAFTRTATLLYGYLAAQHLPPLPWLGIANSWDAPATLTMLWRFDAAFYMQIVEGGYNFSTTNPSRAAFMPLLPALMALVKLWGVSPALSGLIIPNVSFIVGLMFFGRATLLSTNTAATVWKACLLLCVYPTAFFFSMPYSESLAFLAVSVAWWAWLKESTGLAAQATFFGCAARLTSLCFPVALLLEWLANAVRRKPNRSLGSIVLILLSGLFAVLLFCLYMRHQVGDPLAHMKAHAPWNRLPPSPQNVGRTFLYLFYYHPRDGNWPGVIAPGLSLILFLGLGLRALKARGVFPAAMILLPLLQALSTGTPMSLERIVLACFLAFIDLAEVLKRPWLFATIAGIFLLLQIVLLNGFVHNQFVG